LVCLGELGIGNTTSASALLSLLSCNEVEDVVGRGTGIDDAQLEHKTNVIKSALKLHNLNRDSDPLEILATFGGVSEAKTKQNKQKQTKQTTKQTKQTKQNKTKQNKQTTKQKKTKKKCEIAAIAGAVIEGHKRNIAIIVDGFISMVSVLSGLKILSNNNEVFLFLFLFFLFLFLFFLFLFLFLLFLFLFF
jgi:NaMN:DMB phosphoribosyltransferase